MEQSEPADAPPAAVESVFVSECFWPNVTDADLRELGNRALEFIARLPVEHAAVPCERLVDAAFGPPPGEPLESRQRECMARQGSDT